MQSPKIGMPRLITLDEMKENEFMMFDMNTGSAILYRNGKIVASTTISKKDLRKAMEVYNIESDNGVSNRES